MPNLLTTFRLLSIFILYFFLFSPTFFSNEFIRIIVVIIGFTLSSLSDYYDGKLARQYKTTSEFGKFYDSLVDKFFVIAIFFFFTSIESLKIISFFIYLIFLRDVFITFLRIMAIKKKSSMSTDYHGKLKTFLQIATQSLILLQLLFFSFIVEYKIGQSLTLKKYQIFNVPWEELEKILVQDYHFPNLLVISIAILPNLLIIGVSIFTVYSGFLYFFKNKNLFYR